MQQIEVPPDATRFRSGELTPFLYLGATEAIALWNEWGLRRTPEDDEDSFNEKRKQFEIRITGTDLNDRLTIMRVALGQWAEQVGVDVSTDKKAALIFDRAIVNGALYGPGKKFGGIYRARILWERFADEMLGRDHPDEEEAEETDTPKDQGLQASIPSETSSSQPSGGASPAAKPTGSRRARSASTSGRATRPTATS